MGLWPFQLSALLPDHLINCNNHIPAIAVTLKKTLQSKRLLAHCTQKPQALKWLNAGFFFFLLGQRLYFISLSAFFCLFVFSREDLIQCRQNIADLTNERSQLEKEIEQKRRAFNAWVQHQQKPAWILCSYTQLIILTLSSSVLFFFVLFVFNLPVLQCFVCAWGSGSCVWVCSVRRSCRARLTPS